MKITATTDDGRIFPLDVGGDLTISDLKAILESDTGLPAATIMIVHNMNPCPYDDYTLADYGITENDMILITTSAPVVGSSVPQPYTSPSHSQAPVVIDWGAISLPSTTSLPPSTVPRPLQAPHAPRGGGNNDDGDASLLLLQQMAQVDEDFLDPDDPSAMRRYFAANPAALAQLEDRNPPLAEALLSGSEEVFADLWRQMRAHQREEERERIRMLNANPFDRDVQARIAGEIDRNNIAENLAAALEHNPESFGRVVMLYLDCRVNGTRIKALVDSGAASTIMSAACAERCGIMRLVDRRFAGVAVGIGRQRILGRVHVCQLQISKGGDGSGDVFLATSFQVLENQVEDMLLGLDMLKRHQCCIDLKEGVLRIGTTGSVAPFLSEKDLQDKVNLLEQQTQHLEAEEMDKVTAISQSERQTSSHNQQSGIAVAPATPPQPRDTPLGISEASIQAITSAGFTRQQAIEELRRCNGNVQLALTALLARSIVL